VQNLAPAQEFAVLAHEFAHELLHHSVDRRDSRDALLGSLDRIRGDAGTILAAIETADGLPRPPN
jgi:hypothetical protein